MHKCCKGAAFAYERTDKICDTARNVEADLENTGNEFTKPPVSAQQDECWSDLASILLAKVHFSAFHCKVTVLRVEKFTPYEIWTIHVRMIHSLQLTGKVSTTLYAPVPLRNWA